MSRSHPPTLLTLAARTLREECGVARGERVLVAVSGGPDSLALLHVLARLSSKHGFFVHAHGVDHGLRPEAAAELDLAAALADSLAVPFERTRLALRAGGNLQARARTARYAALAAARLRAGAHYLATAHHADDRAETVLLRLLRGAGPRGLAVLPARSGERIRPFLRAQKRDILAHLARHALTYATDPSNRDPRFQRVRVRDELLPLLRELSPGIVGHLTNLADALGGEDSSEPVAARNAAIGAPGAPPELLVAALGRAQRLQLARAVKFRQHRAEIWLADGREARVIRTENAPLVVQTAPGETQPLGRIAPRPRRKATPAAGHD